MTKEDILVTINELAAQEITLCNLLDGNTLTLDEMKLAEAKRVETTLYIKYYEERLKLLEEA